MKKIIILAGLALAITSCGDKKAEGEAAKTDSVSTVVETPVVEAPAEVAVDVNSTPEAVIATIANAAKTGDYSKLPQLCNDAIDTDKDSKGICSLDASDTKKSAEFKEYFSTLAVDGTPEITANDAKVKVTFGPKSDAKETMNMKKVEGKWFLTGF